MVEDAKNMMEELENAKAEEAKAVLAEVDLPEMEEAETAEAVESDVAEAESDDSDAKETENKTEKADETKTYEDVVVWTEESARKALEEAREAENRAYHGMSHAVLTNRQKGILELARIEEEDEEPDQALLDQKCRLILESYILPRALKEGSKVRLNREFTRGDDPSKDYIEAVFTTSAGKTRNVGYNYKTEDDGKNIILFEKVFETVILKPGEPEKYVLYELDGTTERMVYTKEELDKKVLRDEIVKIDDVYFRKATNVDGEVRQGETTMIVEDEGLNNTKIIIGNNEQYKYSISKNGQLVCATTNDVTTVTIETRKIAGPGPIFNSIEDARNAAAKEVQNGETNLKVDVAMEGTTVAEFGFLPVYTTSIELNGLAKKIGKGVEGYDINETDEENLRRMLAKPINQYLDEKGFQVLDIVCENLEADVKENVGWINTMKTYQMTGGVVAVTYIKRNSAVVSLKQGFLGRGQGVDEAAVLAQLPEGSELLNPQDIDWKNPKPTVTYVMRGHATGVGSAKSVDEADEAAAQSAIQEAQRITVKGLNGGIASGIREAIGAQGGVSTVANVRTRLETPMVSKNDMELTRREPKYAFTATCDKMVTSVENKLVSVTSWNGDKLVYVPATDPIVDKGIPTDENYERYIKEGDDLGILLFEKTDRGLRRYMDEVKNAQVQAGRSIALFDKARVRLRDMQEIFDKLYDEKVARLAREAEEAALAEAEAAEAARVEEATARESAKTVGATETVESIEPIEIEAEDVVMAVDDEEAAEIAAAVAAAAAEAAENEAGQADSTLSAQEALLEIFGESAADVPVESEPVKDTPVADEPVMTAQVLGGAVAAPMTTPVLGGAVTAPMTTPVLGGAGGSGMTSPVLGGMGGSGMTTPVLGGMGGSGMTTPVLGGMGGSGMTTPVLGGMGGSGMTTPVLGGMGGSGMTTPVLGGAGGSGMTAPVLGGAGGSGMTTPVLGGAVTAPMTTPVLNVAEVAPAQASTDDNRMLSAQEALLEIFGESALETPVEPTVTQTVPTEASTEQSQEDVDAAFAKLLNGGI